MHKQLDTEQNWSAATGGNGDFAVVTLRRHSWGKAIPYGYRFSPDAARALAADLIRCADAADARRAAAPCACEAQLGEAV